MSALPAGVVPEQPYLVPASIAPFRLDAADHTIALRDEPPSGGSAP